MTQTESVLLCVGLETRQSEPDNPGWTILKPDDPKPAT